MDCDSSYLYPLTMCYTSHGGHYRIGAVCGTTTGYLMGIIYNVRRLLYIASTPPFFLSTSFNADVDGLPLSL